MATSSPPGLVGRVEELERLREALGAAARGAAGMVLVEGEAGIGKTRLLASLAAEARGRGVTVLRGEAHALERTRPFGPLVDALGLRAGARDPRRAAIGRLLTAEAGPGDGGARAAEEIVELVEVLSGRSPVLLALEDLHWADGSTLLAVRWLARRLRGVPVLLVGTLRPSPRAPELAQLLDDALREGATALRLEPLGPRDVDDLVRAELGRAPGPALAAAVRRAGGNPLWVVELVRALAAEDMLAVGPGGVELTSPGLPDSLRELVSRRVGQLPAATVALLRVASVLGDAFTMADLAAVTGRRAADLAAELDEALRARLLGDGEGGLVFRHALVRDAIYRDVPASVRLALHREAGRALQAAGAPLAQVASHAFLGAAPGDLEAIGALRRAAGEAAAPAPAVAVELLRRAESLLPDGHPERDSVLAELVEALLRAGQVAQAAALAEAVLARPHAPAADRALRLSLIEALSLQNRPEDLIAQGTAALASAPRLGPADRALVLAQTSYGHTFSGDLAGGERVGRRALALAEAAGDAAMRAWCLTTLSVPVKTQGRYGEALALAERAVRLACDPPDLAARLRHPHFFLGLARCDADLMAGAAESYRAAIRECEELGSAWILPDARLMAAELRFLVGEWDDAVPELEAGLEAAADRGALILLAQSRGYLAIMATARGDRRAAEAALEPVRAAGRYGEQVAGFASALLAEAEGRPGDALGILRRIWARDAARGDRYHHRSLAPAIVRLAAAVGDEALAREVTGAALAGAALAPGVPSVRSAALRCRAMVRRDADAAIAAVALARRSGRVLDAAGACEDAAAVLVGVGRAAEARDLLDEALDRYDALDAAWLAARAGAALREAGGRRGRRGPRRRPEHGWASLTPSERAVAELVAEGLTNREVGRRLFVSPHTVNSHLRHAFRKLGVSSRAALAAAAAREDRAIG